MDIQESVTLVPKRANRPICLTQRWSAAAALLAAVFLLPGTARSQTAATTSAVPALEQLVRPLRALADPALDDDLAAFAPALRDARVIALGEATHGTHEFFAFKHRMVRWLVEQRGFRAFLIEGSVMNVTAIDDWVRGAGEEAAITELMGRHLAVIWNTVEVRDMLIWMRSFNRTHPADPVRFLGFDPQLATPSAACLMDFLAKAAPARVADARRAVGHLTPVTHQFAYAEYPARPQAERERARDTLLQLLGRLTLDELTLTSATSPEAYRRALHCVRLLVQSDETRNLDEDAREPHMADNILRAVAEHGGRGIVWAHNFHISRVPSGFRPWQRTRDFKPMGAYLSDRLGKGYYALGMAFDHGSFSAGDEDADERGESFAGMKAFSLPPSPPGMFGHALAGVSDLFLLDLRGLPSSSPARAWFALTHSPRYAGAGFSNRWSEKDYSEALVPAAHFDGLLFVRRTTASRLLPYRPAIQRYTG